MSRHRLQLAAAAPDEPGLRPGEGHLTAGNRHRNGGHRYPAAGEAGARQAPLPARVWEVTPEAVPIDREEVRRYLGYRPGKTRTIPRAEAAVDEGIALAHRLVRPRAVTLDCAVVALSRSEVTLALGARWQSRSLAAHLQGSTALTLLAATVGDQVEEQVSGLFGAGEYAVAVSLDAAATVALHGWVGRLLQQLEVEAGAPLTQPFSPGYGDWAVAAQSEVLELVGARQIGLRANAAHYLMPQKSLVAAMGWLAAGAGIQSRPSLGCRACRLRDCRYRQE